MNQLSKASAPLKEVTLSNGWRFAVFQNHFVYHLKSKPYRQVNEGYDALAAIGFKTLCNSEYYELTLLFKENLMETVFPWLAIRANKETMAGLKACFEKLQEILSSKRGIWIAKETHELKLKQARKKRALSW